MAANTHTNKPKRVYKLTPKMEAAKWKPGQSGNPRGRPRKLTDELEKMLDERVPNDPQKRKYARLFIESCVKRAITKSDVLAKEIFDRVEGKASMSEEDQASRGISVIIMDVPRPDRSAITVQPMKKPAQE